MLAITWRGGNAVGYSDILPLNTMREEGLVARFVHLVRGPRGWEGAATCALKVGKKSALLDYTDYPAENTSAGMELGVLRVWTNSGKPRVEWRSGKRGMLKRANVSVAFENEIEMPTYKPANTRGQRKLREVTERPGQVRFRARMMLVYGGQCCITRCSVAEVLEGAHIDPYQNPTQDSPQNGLLLRRDLHALFDANLLTVSPHTRKVMVTAALRRSNEYSKYHGKVIAMPNPGFSSASPDAFALGRRFDLFEG